MIQIIDAIRALVPNAECTFSDTRIGRWHDSRPQPSQEEIDAKFAELKAVEPLRQLREQRTRILSKSDWMANSDVTMSDAWRDYRQALRDLPANSPNVALDEQGNLINVTWPTKPE
jgi:hypothetical protein